MFLLFVTQRDTEETQSPDSYRDTELFQYDISV